MKVNKLHNEWTSNLGGCVELPADGCVIAVQCPPQTNVLFTILHEAVHVWQMCMSYMQEDAPGLETEAYTIEHIAKELMLQYQQVTGETLAVYDKRKARLQKRESPLQLPPGDSETPSGTECGTKGHHQSGPDPQGGWPTSRPQAPPVQGWEGYAIQSTGGSRFSERVLQSQQERFSQIPDLKEGTGS